MSSDSKSVFAEQVIHLGIDLGGTKTEIIALDSQNKEHWRKRVPSAQGSYQGTLDTLSTLFEEGAQRFEQRLTLGIGIPGAIDPQSQRVKNANSTWLIGQAMQADLNARLSGHPQLAASRNAPVNIANDADCFALSEASDGAGSEFKSVFGVILGTGVGGGLVYHQQLLAGPNAISGEWGHNPMPVFSEEQASEIWSEQGKLDCYCGQKNCIETFLSGLGMALRYAKHVHKQTAPEKQTLTSEAIVSAWRDGELNARAFFERYIDWLARALAGVINLVDPDAIVLGGGLSNIDELYSLLPSALEPYVFSNKVNTQILKARHGDSSGVRGAAWLGRSAADI